MRCIYNIILVVLFLLSSPFYFLKMRRRGNWRGRFGQRFGLYSSEDKAALAGTKNVWMHAVSVGEVGLCAELIRALEPQLKGFQIVVSTTTSTGMAELERKLPAAIRKIYYPVDLWWGVRSAMNTIHPVAIILVEAEIWPNLLWRALDNKIPLFLVNARVSERSYRGYQRSAFLFRDIFSRFHTATCQDQIDATRLASLGFDPARVHVVGNLKFDSAIGRDGQPLDVRGLLSRIGVPPQARLLVAGSTHQGEEVILAEIAQRLRQRWPDLFLVLVPRHFERAREVGAELAARNIHCVFRSDIPSDPKCPDCLIVNTTGELKRFYTEASLVFVGKSLTAQGGQNPIEPAALGKAVLFGPNMQNFPAIAPMLVKNGGAIQVADAAELERTLGELLGDEPRRQALGRSALEVVQRNLGAVQRTVDLIARGVAN
jgi:3-deoxy-D-manno-octulosonic-acid transferase